MVADVVGYSKLVGRDEGELEIPPRKPAVYWSISGPTGTGETVRIGRNGGGLEARIQRSPRLVDIVVA